MVNHGHHTHALCLLAMMMSKELSLSFSNQRLSSLWNPSLIWFMDQFDQRLSIDITDSSHLHCPSSLVMSIQWNRDLLPCRRFGSGAFSCRRWSFRLSTGECPLTRGYGGFTWVFDPGINRVLAEEKDVIKLMINEIIPLYLMETEKNFRAQWVTSHCPVPLFVFGKDEEYDSDLSVSNHKTERSSKLVRMIRREAIHKTTVMERNWYRTLVKIALGLVEETHGVWYYIFSMEVKVAEVIFQFKRHKVNDMRRWPDVKILNHPSMNVDIQVDELEEESYFQLKIDVASTSSTWPFDFLDWVLVYLGTQVPSRVVTSDFKKSMWVIRQRRLPNVHSESLPKSSNILISTKR